MPNQLVTVAPDASPGVWSEVAARLALEETRLMIHVAGMGGGTYGNAAYRILRRALGITGEQYREITKDRDTDSDDTDSDEDEECQEAMSCCGYCTECEDHHGDIRDEVCDAGHCHDCDHRCDD